MQYPPVAAQLRRRARFLMDFADGPLKQAYAEMDKNHDGKVSKEELKACLKSVGSVMEKFGEVWNPEAQEYRKMNEEESDELLDSVVRGALKQCCCANPNDATLL